MKKWFTYGVILILFLGWIPSMGQTCSKTITSATPYINADDSQFQSIQPGDTVCLQAGNWDYIQLQNFHGTADKPITFVNSGGSIIINTTHYFGIKIGNCSHVILRGNGDANEKYGFRILGVTKGAGMGVDDMSTNIEISHVEISNTFIGGVYAKTDPVCGNYAATREKFTMYDFSFHDCYVHDVPNEGLYIGNSHYSGLHLTNGCDTIVYPEALKGVRIYNNIIENTGYDGIQVSSADSNCAIHDNVIKYDSQDSVLYQMSGIIIGGGSKCDTYNNQIINGMGDGIDVFGLGNYSIFNNLIVNAGKDYRPSQPDQMKHGIYVGTDTTETNAVLGIYNNTIVSPKSFGITIANSKLGMTKIINNLITTPGKFSDVGAAAFINLNVDSAKVQLSTNYTTNDTAVAKFVAPDTMNYQLQPNSPAIDFGTDLTNEGVTFDLLNQSRPYHNLFDAGAYECHDPSVGIRSNKAPDVGKIIAYPNPAKQSINLKLTVSSTQNVTVFLTDLFGRTLAIQKKYCEASRPGIFVFDVNSLPEGMYFLVVHSQKGKSTKTFIVEP